LVFVLGKDEFEVLGVVDSIENGENGTTRVTDCKYQVASGKPGVVLVTSGPGATNVITPMQDAMSDGTPMVDAARQLTNGLDHHIPLGAGT
jgi:glyoxylate carboligase